MSLALILSSIGVVAGAEPLAISSRAIIRAATDGLAATVARAGDEVVCFELSSVALRPSRIMLQARALSAPQGPAPAPGIPLWYGALIGPRCSDELSFAPAEGGAWGIALEVHGGGTRGVYLWRGEEAPLDLRGEREHASVSEVVLDNVATEDGTGSERLSDLLSPVLFSRGEQILLVGSGRGVFTRRFAAIGDEVVWLARLDDADFARIPSDPTAAWRPPSPKTSKQPRSWSLPARAIADGIDPRVATLGNRVVLAVRRARSAAESEGVGPLSFSTSTDLVEWTAAAELSADFAVTDGYALAADNDALWLAAATSEDPPRPGVLRFDENTRSWIPVAFVEDGPAPALPRARERLWLLPDPGPRGPLLVYRGADGALVRRQLP